MKPVESKVLAAFMAATFLTTTPAVAQDDPLSVIFVSHATESNTFWLTVKKGMEDACERFEADCQIIFASATSDVQGQVNNILLAIAQSPDMIVTSILDDRAYDEVIEMAAGEGISVIAANVDDKEGAKGNARSAYIGQSFITAGQALSTRAAADFPAEGPIRVLVGVNAPSGNWSRQRADGIILGLENWKEANPDRDILWEEIDAGLDYGTTAERFSNYLTLEPNLTAYFDTGFWDVGAASTLRERGIQPGKVILAGFDLVPDVISEMKEGYIQYHVDQQPYLQGYIPVVQAFLQKNFGLKTFDVDAGSAIVSAAEAVTVEELSRAGYR